MSDKKIPKMAIVKRLEQLALDGQDYRTWYVYARAQLPQAAKTLAISIAQLADLLSLFSPRVSVKRSIRFTIHYIKNNREFAHDVTSSIKAAVRHYELSGEIRGPKTFAFSQCLKGSDNHIVLDTWMAVAFGIDQTRFSAKYVRIPCEKRIRAVARRLGWPYAETQAAIWAGVFIESEGNSTDGRRRRYSVPEFDLLSELDGVPF